MERVRVVTVVEVEGALATLRRMHEAAATVAVRRKIRRERSEGHRLGMADVDLGGEGG